MGNSQAEINGGSVEGQPVLVGFAVLLKPAPSRLFGLLPASLRCRFNLYLHLTIWYQYVISSIQLAALCSFYSAQFILSLNLYDACRSRMCRGFTVYIKTWPWGKRCLTSVFMRQAWVRVHPDLFAADLIKCRETLLIVDGWKMTSRLSYGQVPCSDSQLVPRCSYGGFTEVTCTVFVQVMGSASYFWIVCHDNAKVHNEHLHLPTERGRQGPVTRGITHCIVKSIFLHGDENTRRPEAGMVERWHITQCESSQINSLDGK